MDNNNRIKKGDHIKRVGIVFSGGPAPGANAVISAAALSFLDDDREVVGFLEGFAHLQKYHQYSYRLLKDVHYKEFNRNTQRPWNHNWHFSRESWQGYN
jgi:6-phosphofructokinase 1